MVSVVARTVLLGGVLLSARFAIACGPVPKPPSWTLVWSDEFNDPDGSRPNARNWSYDLGGNGWGNQELQSYTDRSPDNVVVRGGLLQIRALRETYTGPDDIMRSFTSARLHTLGRFAQAYGRFEARIKLPAGRGLWPAFWMLGDNYKAVGWPDCGEIDIMDSVGREPATIHGALHGPGFGQGTGLATTYTLPGNRSFADDFHVFSTEWRPGALSFFVDGVQYRTIAASEVSAPARWVFDHPFFLLLNIAVGGDWPGPPDTSTEFPQTMAVDYVRVYGIGPERSR